MKQCTKCKNYFPETKFASRAWVNKNGTKTFRKKSHCRDCVNQDNLNRYHEKPNTKLAHRRASYKHRLKLYGLSIPEYEKMVDEQDGLCAICEQRPGKMLVVDHCHKSGKIRQLLCNSCNTALGHIRENPEYIKSMLRYVARHSD